MGSRAGLDDVEENISPLPGLVLRPIGRPASRYTDSATPLPIIIIIFFIIIISLASSVTKMIGYQFDDWSSISYRGHIHSFKPYFLKVHFNILPSTLRFPKLSLSFICGG
jgi:hypothetical protein